VTTVSHCAGTIQKLW